MELPRGKENEVGRDTTPLTLRLFGRFEAYIHGTPLPVIHSRHEHLLLAVLALAKGQEIDRSIVAERLWPPEEYSSYRADSNLRRSLYNLRKALGEEAYRLPDPQLKSRTLSFDFSGTDVDIITFDSLITRRQPEAIEEALQLYRGPLLEGYTDTQIMESHPGWLWILEERRKREQALQTAESLLKVLLQELPAPKRESPILKGNLPIFPTRFIQRENDISQVVSSLQSQRLVTLTGSGGVGKTSLALRVAEEIKEGFADGAWFVDLSVVTTTDDAQQIVDVLSRTFHIRPTPPGRDILQGVVDYFREKSLLLLLDNCEHVINATLPVLSAILEHCPGVCTLATSRQNLGLPGETRWYVPSLPTPDPNHLPKGSIRWVEYIRPFASVELFMERAKAVRPNIEITPDNAQAIAEICHRLDGIPLALILAAARLQVTSFTELARSLDELFVPAPIGYRVPKERHRTLLSLIDWSYELLSEEEQKVLRRLSLFRGGWTTEAAECICSDTTLRARQVRSTIERLVEKSLVIFEDKGSVTRHRLLETVRQHGVERLLENQEFHDYKLRHLNHFMEMAEQAEPGLRGAEQGEWLRKLEADNDNLRVAMEYAFTEATEEFIGPPPGSGATEQGLRLAGALWHFWEMRGAQAEGYRWIRAALAQSTESGIPRARAMVAVAVVADDFCEGSQVLHFVELGIQLARDLGSRWWTGFGLLLLGWVYRSVDMEIANAHMEEALQLAREEGEPWLIAFVCSAMGYHEMDQGKIPSARSRCQEALKNVSRTGDVWLLDETVYHLGLVACYDGAFDEALHHFGACLDYQKQLGTQTRSALVRYYKANIHFRKKELDMARSLLHESLRRAKEFRTPRTMAVTFRSLASLTMEFNQPDRAATLFGAASGLQESIDTSLLSIWNADFEDYESRARMVLGEDVYAVHTSRGQIMTLEQAVAYALE